ncbi:PREDICTED: uncharacterized protein LOC106120412 [Papilio xuthus]|uniref:Uncharacterized protein LOC106120412 n=1 Tax=Papilio xuthus TaxID=66420 RepID=A0AAJ6ZF30_PAPXU|nr:PREDICTED: uncharacterized protein LOC106120412 [Papilio xuthus]
MKSILLIGFFVHLLMMSKADYSTKHARHSNIRNTHERRGRQNYWQPTNYRTYEPNYQHYYPGFNNANRQEALTAEIINLLRELKDLSAQRQRQNYQPIYVPYPIPMSIPLSSHEKPKVVTNKPIPAFPSRINFPDDEKEYMRPIMLKPVTEAPFTTTTRKTSDSESAIVFRVESQNDIREPSKCEAAILVCCRFSQAVQVKTCFSEYGCSKTYSTKLACEKKAIQTVIQRFADSFGPK